MSFTGRVIGVSFYAWLVITSLCGALYGNGLFLPLLFVSPKLYRKLYDKVVMDSWLKMHNALLELLLGVQIIISGDTIRSGERNIFLMNHRTRLDWMFFWSVLVRSSGVTTEKIILKSILKKIPGPGWAMQAAAFIFLERKWEDDKTILRKTIKYFSDINHATQLLLFPEGTVYKETTKRKSDEFARKNGLPPYEYVLHPRTTGFTFLVDYMRQQSHLDAVYDIAVGYPVNFAKDESDLVKGNFPKEVHFSVKRYEVKSLPSTEKELQLWCQKLWSDKEQALETFYKAKQFGYGDKRCDVLPNRPNNLKCDEGFLIDSKARKILALALIYWILIVVVIITLLFSSSIIRYYTVFQIFFFVFITHVCGGFELFQVNYFNLICGSNQRSRKEK